MSKDGYLIRTDEGMRIHSSSKENNKDSMFFIIDQISACNCLEAD